MYIKNEMISCKVFREYRLRAKLQHAAIGRLLLAYEEASTRPVILVSYQLCHTTKVPLHIYVNAILLKMYLAFLIQF